MKTTRPRILRLVAEAIPLILVISGFLSVQPGGASTGTEGAAFLNIPVGATPAAMGGAYSAMAEDAYAPAYNPAGLGRVTQPQISGQHLAYLESMNYEYLSAVYPLHRGRAIGFSVQYLGTGDIAGLDVNGNSIGNFSAHYAAYTLSYGHALTEKLAVGGSSKWINAKIDDVSANAFAADGGVYYQYNSKLSLAGVLTNLGSTMKFISQKDDLPLAFKFGGAYRLSPHWTFSGETVYRKTGLLSAHLGTAWRPVQHLSLRGGFRTDTLKGLGALAGLSLGIGIHLWEQEFSYAWLPMDDLGNTNYFSLVIRFGDADGHQTNLVRYQKTPSRGESDPTVEEIFAPDYQQLMELLSAEEGAATAFHRE